MPILGANNGVNGLTWGEVQERLKLNPDDPELQEYRKANERLAEIFMPTTREMNLMFDSIREAARGATMVSDYIATFQKSLNFDSLRIFKEAFDAQKRIVEAFQMPSHLFEGFKTLSEQVSLMDEPLKLMSQAFAVYRTPNLFNELTKINTSWITPGLVVTEQSEIIDSELYEKKLVEEKQVFVDEVEVLEDNKLQYVDLPYFYYQASKTLLLQVRTIVPIPLYSRRGNTNVEAFVTTLLDLMEERGEIIGDFKRIFIPAKELFQRLIRKGFNDVDTNWVANTKSTFINQKVPEITGDGIMISDYDRTKEGYLFQIRVKIPLPKELI